MIFKMLSFIVATCLIIIRISIIECAPTDPVVTTKLGKIRGTVKTLDDGSEVNLFYGIPYGKPPIGNLRFSKPQPASSWEGVYDATSPKFVCMQPPNNWMTLEAHQSEDCLYLSVWQPSRNTTDGKKRSVMFWVHGGAFEVGTMFSFVFDARYIASVGDVIVVTINYRLNAFGFLYGETSDAPGNVGLQDQILALKWTYDNIDAFGGDPSSITIFGESAGGMSIGAIVLSPLAAGLFKGAIMQSGSPLISDSKDSALIKTKNLASRLNCTKASSVETLNCIRNKDAKEIVRVLGGGPRFWTIYGDEVMPLKPMTALKAGKFNHVNLLFGTVRDEGSVFVTWVSPDMEPNKPSNLTIEKAKSNIKKLFADQGEAYGDVVADFYTSGLSDNDRDLLRKAVSESYGDYILTCPTVLFGSAFASSSKDAKAYAYRLTHKLPNQILEDCTGWLGVCHGDDDVILFGFPIKLRGIGFTEIDYQFSIDFIHTWATFAKTGEPPAQNNVKWIEAIDRSIPDPFVKYMELNPAKYRIVENEYKTTCEGFWKNFFN